MVRCSFLVWMAAGSVAFAADINEDGCQDEYASNGACVDVDATVDGTSTVGANATVLERASIGPEVALGTDVVVGARASLAGRVAHSSNPITVGAGSIIGRSTQLGADHMIGDDVTIGRSVVAGARLTMAANGSLGYAAQVGTDVTIGAGAVAGNLVTLGDFATLGDNAVVSRNVTISDGINSGDGASVNGIVGPNVLIAASARIEQGGRVRKQADIGAGAAIESSGRVGRGAVIEAGATVFGRVAANATVGAGATVEAGATVARGGEVCAGNTLPTGSQVLGDGTWPVEGCTLTGQSCQTIKDSAPSAADGVYTIDPDGTGGADAFDAYCDMTTDAAYGWTLCYSASQSMGNTTVTGWHDRFNTTAHGVGEYARDCKAITSDTGASTARVQYVDGAGTIWAELSPAPALADSNYYEFTATSGTHNVGIEIANNANPGRGHCFDQNGENGSWGRAGTSASCFLNTIAAGWYSGLTHVEYWVR